jgi:hypothetical protein
MEQWKTLRVVTLRAAKHLVLSFAIIIVVQIGLNAHPHRGPTVRRVNGSFKNEEQGRKALFPMCILWETKNLKSNLKGELS